MVIRCSLHWPPCSVLHMLHVCIILEYWLFWKSHGVHIVLLNTMTIYDWLKIKCKPEITFKKLSQHVLSLFLRIHSHCINRPSIVFSSKNTIKLASKHQEGWITARELQSARTGVCYWTPHKAHWAVESNQYWLHNTHWATSAKTQELLNFIHLHMTDVLGEVAKYSLFSRT